MIRNLYSKFTSARGASNARGADPPGPWILCLSVVLCLPAGAITSIEFQAGLADDFAGGPDPATPSAALAAIIASDGFGSTAEFDAVPTNQQIAHTFDGLPSGITAATLEVRVRAEAGSFGVENDGLIISFVDSETTSWLDDIVWARTLGSFPGGGQFFFAPDNGLLTPGSPWEQGSVASATLDLAALPKGGGNTINLLPLLNEKGFLDVTVRDDSAADHFRLEIIVPEPAASALLLVTGLLLVRARFRRESLAG